MEAFDFDLLTHLLGHRLKTSSKNNTDFITQQLIASRSTDACWQPDILTEKAAQGLEPWHHPSSKLWHDREALANRAMLMLTWVSNSCQHIGDSYKVLISKLYWLIASQIAGVRFKHQLSIMCIVSKPVHAAISLCIAAYRSFRASSVLCSES